MFFHNIAPARLRLAIGFLLIALLVGGSALPLGAQTGEEPGPPPEPTAEPDPQRKPEAARWSEAEPGAMHPGHEPVARSNSESQQEAQAARWNAKPGAATPPEPEPDAWPGAEQHERHVPPMHTLGLGTARVPRRNAHACEADTRAH